jgi:hypothetical protein
METGRIPLEGRGSGFCPALAHRCGRLWRDDSILLIWESGQWCGDIVTKLDWVGCVDIVGSNKEHFGWSLVGHIVNEPEELVGGIGGYFQ